VNRELYKVYKDLRTETPFLSAAQTILWARWRLKPLKYKFEDNKDCTHKFCLLTIDGFGVKIIIKPDYDNYNDFDDMGCFTDTIPRKGEEYAILSAPSGLKERGDFYRSEYTDELLTVFIFPEHLKGLYDYYKKDWSYSKGVAFQRYREAIRDAVKRAVEFRTYDREYYYVQVKVFLAGVEMASTTFCGTEILYGDPDTDRHFDEIADDALTEALAEAKETFLAIQDSRSDIVLPQKELLLRIPDPTRAIIFPSIDGWEYSVVVIPNKSWDGDLKAFKALYTELMNKSRYPNGLDEDQDDDWQFSNMVPLLEAEGFYPARTYIGPGWDEG